MVKLQDNIRQIILLIAAIGLTSTLGSCIYEDMSDCPPDTYLYIKVTGDHSEDELAGLLENASLYLFDSEERYLDQLPVDIESIIHHQPISLPYAATEIRWISVWGNITDHVEVTGTKSGEPMTRTQITLRKDGEYASTQDDLFFGVKRVNLSTTEEIQLSRKNARMVITTRGIQDRASDYYFTIREDYNGYDFKGNLFPEEALLRQEGTFSGNELATPVFHLIHYLPESSNHVTINLYEKSNTRSGDRLLAFATNDIDGRPLVPIAGKTTNVLMNIRVTGDVGIYVEISPWDEVHQWTEW